MKKKDTPSVVQPAYYTPTMDEFYIGFEFEVLNTKSKFFIPNIGEGIWHEISVGFGIFGDLSNIHKLILEKQIRVKGISDEDFNDIGCVLQIDRCPFYGTKYIYKLDGVKESEQGWMDGFDTTYFIEPVRIRDIDGNSRYGMVKIIKIDVGGFAGGESREQIFHGFIKNKSELIRTLRQLRCIQV